MNEYNIKVGDYVETWDGDIGYVVDIYANSFKWMTVKARSIFNTMNSGEMTSASFNSIKNYYKRIGINDFNEKKTIFKSIEKLDICYAS